MDLLSIFRTFKRHWLVAMPVILLTVACAAYVLVLRPTDYEATASVALLASPGAPRDEAGDPIAQTAAGRTESPLSRYGDQGVVVNIVAKAISTDSYREKLQAQGADTRYEIGQGTSSPIADITAIASTPEGAVTTAQLVAAAFVDELQQIQLGYGVDPDYMISTLPVEVAEDATAKFSSSIRLAVAVVGLGVIATFFVVSIAEARRQVKEERRLKAQTPGDSGDTTTRPPGVETSGSDDATTPPPAPPASGDAESTGDGPGDGDDGPPQSPPPRNTWGQHGSSRPSSLPARPLRGR
jgi:hypothetical protein